MAQPVATVRNGNCCAICLEETSDDCDRTVVRLRCSHAYHLDCIGCAFNATGIMRCPYCRRREKGTWLRFNRNNSSSIEDSFEPWSDDERDQEEEEEEARRFQPRQRLFDFHLHLHNDQNDVHHLNERARGNQSPMAMSIRLQTHGAGAGIGASSNNNNMNIPMIVPPRSPREYSFDQPLMVPPPTPRDYLFSSNDQPGGHGHGGMLSAAATPYYGPQPGPVAPMESSYAPVLSPTQGASMAIPSAGSSSNGFLHQYNPYFDHNHNHPAHWAQPSTQFNGIPLEAHHAHAAALYAGGGGGSMSSTSSEPRTEHLFFGLTVPPYDRPRPSFPENWPAPPANHQYPNLSLGIGMHAPNYSSSQDANSVVAAAAAPDAQSVPDPDDLRRLRNHLIALQSLLRSRLSQNQNQDQGLDQNEGAAADADADAGAGAAAAGGVAVLDEEVDNETDSVGHEISLTLG